MNINFSSRFTRAILIVYNYWAITDNTSTSILLNSSRQAQAPYSLSPEKSLPISLYSIYSEQLNTTQITPKPLARSFVLSVLPVPAGPAGAAPN